MKPEPRKRNRLSLSLLSITMLAIGVLFLSACREQEEANPLTPQAKLVRIMVLEAPAKAILRKIPGQVEANQQAELTFQVTGPLIELPVKEGDIVEKGNLLARIDPQDFENALNVRRAELEEARRQYDRFQKLLASKTVSKDQYEEKKADYEIAEAYILQAEKDFDDTYLRAPFRGVVATRYVENFQNVRAKQPILLLEDISSLGVVINIPEQDLIRANTAAFQHGAEVGVVTFEAFPEHEYPVTVKKFQTRADPLTRTYKATLNLPAPKDINILPGMAATFTPMVDRNVQADVFAIPMSAVAADETGKAYVWVVNKDSMTVQQRNVTLGTLTGKNVRVLSGLKSGDVIVTAGSPYLAEGLKIRLATNDGLES